MIRRRRLLTILASASLVVALEEAHAGIASPSQEPAPRPTSWLPAPDRLETLRKQLDVPGLAFVGIENCRPLTPINVGMATLNPNHPVRDQTVFEAASLSKPVFAYLVLQLIQEGVIALDEPIARSFAYPRITDQHLYARITPRMVLSHRTGLPNWASDAGEPGTDAPIAFVTEPGTAYSYSGEAYELLRLYVEARTNRTLEALFHDRLGDVMPLSAFAPPAPQGAEAAGGYAKASDPESGRGLTYLRREGSSAAGLVTTPLDYARFVGRLCERSGLSEETYTAMFDPQTPVTGGEFPGPASYGLGWAIMRLGEDTVILHGGNNDEFRSFAAFDPRTREGVVMFANGRYGGDLIDAILEEIQ